MTAADDIRGRFPFLKNTVDGSRPSVYFDNAATSQKPDTVIDLADRMFRGLNANVHRAVHRLGVEVTDLYEAGREAAREFVNAASREEIILTSGTTASINLLAYTFGERFISEGDVILLTEAEHHSNIVPWQMLALRKKARLMYLPVDERGVWRMDLLEGLMSSGRVRIVSAAHVSNVLGLVNPVGELVRTARKYGAYVHIDGAQGIVHSRVDVQALDCDFYSFSGHKVYAATGTGILYGKKGILEQLPPWMGGGDMVDTVTYGKTTYAPLPLKFEAGTQNVIGAATLAPALRFARSADTPEMEAYQRKIVEYMTDELHSVKGLRLYGDAPGKIPLFSFTVDGIHHSDIATLLDHFGFAVRSGLMCSEPLIGRFGQSGMVRASLLVYNTIEECSEFMAALRKAIRMLS